MFGGISICLECKKLASSISVNIGANCGIPRGAWGRFWAAALKRLRCWLAGLPIASAMAQCATRNRVVLKKKGCWLTIVLSHVQYCYVSLFLQPTSAASAWHHIHRPEPPRKSAIDFLTVNYLLWNAQVNLYFDFYQSLMNA